MNNIKNRIELSKEFFKRAYKMQMEGKFEDAIMYYQKSLDYYPTAKTYTFLGWAYSSLGNFEKAIDKCKIAIDMDPEFGNPYNDIGAYLINLDRFEEARAWLELAVNANNYDNKEFAFFNLGVVYEKTGLWFEALEQYRKAMKIKPDYLIAEHNFKRVLGLLN